MDGGGARFMSLVQSVETFLSTENVPFDRDDELGLIRFFFVTENGNWMVTVHPFEDAQQLVVFSHFPSVVEEGRRSAVAEFATRVNSDLFVGSFDVDVDVGQVRFRTGLDLDDLDVTQALIRNLVYSNVSVMDGCLPALNRVAHGGAEPKAAAEESRGE
jgi:hypothetical protein